MKIVVLAGGLSPERDVSLSSGKMVAKALQKRGHQVLLLDVYIGYGTEGELPEQVFSGGQEELTIAGISGTAPDLDQVKALRKDPEQGFFGPNVIRICKMADIVFMGLHGADGENGKLQAAFDLYGVKYTGSGYLGSALAMSKVLTKQLFVANGIPTPKEVILRKTDRDLEQKIQSLECPCVVKPSSGGSSIGVSIVAEAGALQKALDEAFRYEEEILVEEYVKGREFSAGVLEGVPLPLIEIEPVGGFYGYENKYQQGGAVETCPARLGEEDTKRIQDCAKKVWDVLGLRAYARMDFLLDDEGCIYCLEANTLPGMTPTSLIPQEAAAAGISFEELCERVVRSCL